MWSIKIVPIRKRVLGSGNLYKIPTRSHFIMVISWGTWTSWPSAISVLFCLFKWVLDSPPGKHMVPLFKLIQKGHVSVEAPGEPGFFCSTTVLQGNIFLQRLSKAPTYHCLSCWHNLTLGGCRNFWRNPSWQTGRHYKQLRSLLCQGRVWMPVLW